MRFITVLTLFLFPILAMAKVNFYAQTNHFSLREGEEWSWEKTAKTPKIKWDNKKPKKDHYDSNRYYVWGTMGRYGTISAVGSKIKPIIVEFRSSQDYSESDIGVDVYTIDQLFNKKELTKVKSNCSVNANSGRMWPDEYQHFYKWHKKGFQPLYIAARKLVSGTFNGGITINYTIVDDFNNFNHEYAYGVERYFSSSSKEITCKILK
ncbi:hypothetical protein ACRPFF_00745 [Neisseria sp. SLRRB23]|uniref:hypothetical protein n=1 Tax=Neisseria sp. SLRRB23 TaxID=3435199 RepID=UPI003D7FBDA0